MNIETKLTQVRQEYLTRITRGDGALLQQVEQHIALRTGKMLRPRLLLHSAATLGQEHFDSRRTLLLAVAVEMLHNASLLHDDVVDRSPERRGAPSVNARWNPAVAILVGDYLLAQLMLLLDEVGDADATRLINSTVIAMVESELTAQELDGRQPDRDTYLRIIDGKTARLFATACAFGNPLHSDYGLHFGRLFQLRDDIADHESTPWTDDLILQERAALAALPHLPIDDPTLQEFTS